MSLPIDTVFDVAYSWHADRWYATVAESPATAPIDDLVASRGRFRPWRLRLLGLNLAVHFIGDRMADRTRTDGSRTWTESWAALVDGEIIIVALRSLRTG